MALKVAPAPLIAFIRPIVAISPSFGTIRLISPSSTMSQPKDRLPPLNMLWEARCRLASRMRSLRRSPLAWSGYD
jgi:hypothetical protein